MVHPRKEASSSVQSVGFLSVYMQEMPYHLAVANFVCRERNTAIRLDIRFAWHYNDRNDWLRIVVHRRRENGQESRKNKI